MPQTNLNLKKHSPLSKPKSNTSSFQHKFILKNTFKRNKRYVNMSIINQKQMQQQITRRKPLISNQNSIDQKINMSFMNTTAALSDKVEQNINIFKLRMSAANLQSNQYQDEEYADQILGYDEDVRKSRTKSSQSSRQSRDTFSNNFERRQTQSARNLFAEQCLIQSNKKIRGMALDKYCSREQYYQSKTKPIPDQRLFNNFSLSKPDQVHTKDFQKYMNRELDFKLSNINLNLEYNTQKLYQDYYYKKTAMQCNFNYKNQTKGPRQFYATRRIEDEAATEIDPEKVKQSYQKVTMLRPKTIDSFYINTGRELPCQLDMRNNNPLTNYWVGEGNKIKRKTKEYNLRKMKDDLVEKRLQQIKQSKKPKFQRKQLCDSMYFRVNKQV